MVKSNKILTISIAAYQVEETLADTLESLLDLDSEMLEDIEILIVNDGSKDKTAEVAEEFEKKYPYSVRLINKENGGHGSTINRGIEEAKGIYFKTIDGDDWVDKEGYIELINYLKDKKEDVVDIVCTPYDLIEYGTRKKLEKIEQKINNVQYRKIYKFTDICDDIYILMHSMTYSTKLLKEHPPKLDEHCFYVDAEYVLLPIPYVETIAFLEKSVYQYQLGSEGQSMNPLNMQKNCTHHEKVLNRVLELCRQQELEIKSADISDKKHLKELKAKYRYLIKGAVKLVNVQHRIYLSYKPKHNVLQKIKLLNKKIKAEYTDVYKANDNKAVACLRVCPDIIYIPAAYALRWKLGMR